MRQSQEPYNVVITGMGGQGLLTVGRTLALAAAREGWRVAGSEKRGGAQRGGAAEVMLRLIPPDGPPEHTLGPGIPAGKLDLLIGLEPLEAWRRVALTATRTTVLLDTTPVEPALARHTGFAVPDWAAIVAGVGANGARIVALDLSAHAKATWGHGVLGNVAALGWLEGAGLLPFATTHLREIAGVALGARGLHAGAWQYGAAAAVGV